MSSQQVAHLTPDYNASGYYIGTLLDQGFEVKSLLGKGLAGDVYFAVHPQFPQEKFAIKFLSTKILDDESKRRFIQEIKISAELGKRSAHIVKVKAYGLHNQFVPYYVMELLPVRFRTGNPRPPHAPRPLCQCSHVVRRRLPRPAVRNTLSSHRLDDRLRLHHLPPPPPPSDPASHT